MLVSLSFCRWGNQGLRFNRNRTMKKHICVVLIVFGGIFGLDSGGWSITSNQISINVNIQNK